MPVDKSNTCNEDKILVENISAKDTNSLDILYEKYVERMLGLAYQFLANKSDAEDLIHDVFIEVWNKAADYNPKLASVLGWLLLRVRSRCLDKIRKQKTKQKFLEKQNNIIITPSKTMHDTYCNNKILEKSLSILSDKQKMVIELSYFKGYTCAEISKQYDIPLGTVKTRLLSAMQKMQQTVANEKRKVQ